MKNKFVINNYFWLTIISLIISMLLRAVEFIVVGSNHIVDNLDIFELKGFGLDFLTVTAISGICLLPYMLLCKLSSKVANITTIILSTLLLSLHFCFIIYFKYEMKPVDIFIFGYSYSELLFTIQTSGVRIWWAFAIVFITAILLSGSFYLLHKIVINKAAKYTFLCVVVLGTFANVIANKSIRKHIENESEYYIMINKSQFFYERLFEYLFISNNVESTAKDIQFAKLFPQKRFVSNDYPLLSYTDFNDVIGNYFNVGKDKPNIVIIISEGLASKFVGDYHGANFMPYLTELSQRSLYWDNCLSTGERSSVATPSILTSTPYGKIGFAREYDSPYHFSFINLLSDYYSSFYYGQGAWFDNKESFLKCNGIDRVVDKSTYSLSYEKVMADDYFWGYRDKDLFTNSLNRISELDKSSPRLDIYFTGTMHPPFDIPDDEYYNRRLDSLSINLSANDKRFIEQYRQYILTLLYTDDAYRDFMNEYSKRDDFNNTIFIITGDHPVTQFPFENTLERFHVPLFIYSPMLNKSKTFHSVNSHFDILPTFVAFLKNKYNMDMPEQNGFIGKVIDTATEMRCKAPIVFMNPNGECIDMFYKNFFISNNRDLYTVNQDFSIRKIDNKPLFNELSSLLPIFSNLRMEVCLNNNIIPDTLFFKSTKPNILSDNTNTDSIYMTNSTPYFSIIDKAPILHGRKYFFEMRGDMVAMPKDMQSPLLIVEVRDSKGKEIYWNSYNPSEKLPLRINFEVKSTDKPVLSIYFWNKDNTQLLIHNPIWKVYTPR